MNKLKKICLGTALGAFLALGTAVAGADNQASWHDGPTLVGTWQFNMTVRVDIPDCANSDPIPFGPNPFPGLISFHEGGTMNEFASRSPASVRSAGFGSWKQTGTKNYKSRHTFMEFDANGALWRSMVIDSKIKLANSGNKYSAIGRLVMTDISGNELKFCATIDGARFKP